MECAEKDDCKSIQFPGIGCLNFNLLEGNHRDISLTFTKTIDDVTTEMDLTVYLSIHMYIVESRDDDTNVLLEKSLGNGMSLEADNVLRIVFGDETFGLDCKKLYYDMLFQAEGDVHHLIKGEINIRRTITRKKDV